MNMHEVNRLRIAAQRIGTKQTAHQAVRHMAAMQAQDYYGALWSIGVRTGLTEMQVIEALERREVVRTWPQRGTLHWVVAEDAGWMTALSAPRLIKGAKRRREQLGLDEATLERSKELFAVALEGGRNLTRPQMMDLLETAGISTKAGRGYHMLWNAAQTGQLYIGPMAGKQQTFGLLADLPVRQRQLEREEAVAELAQRYFVSHGPATVQDFMWWSGLTATDAKTGLAAAGSVLRSEVIEGREYWLAADLELGSMAVDGVRLLAGFDEYLLGYKDRSFQLDAEHFELIVPGGNGMFAPTIVVDGRVAGKWQRKLTAKGVGLTYEWFAGQVAPDAELGVAARLYADFLGMTQL